MDYFSGIPTNTRRSANTSLMFANRLRRLANLKTTFAQHLVFRWDVCDLTFIVVKHLLTLIVICLTGRQTTDAVQACLVLLLYLWNQKNKTNACWIFWSWALRIFPRKISHRTHRWRHIVKRPDDATVSVNLIYIFTHLKLCPASPSSG